jgi:hypothetical protein
MRKTLLSLFAAVVLLSLIIGCSTDDNSVTSPTDLSQLRPNAPTVPAIGGRVWNDVNMDGIQGDVASEPGLPDISINLYDCEDTIFLAVTTTDSTGNYAFDALEPSVYQMHFMLPDGYMFSAADQGDNDSLDSDADPNSGMTFCQTVDTGTVDLIWAAGMYRLEEDSGCTRSKGYWKNHAGLGPQDDMVTDLLPIWLGDAAVDTAKGLAVTDAQMAVDVLQMHTYGAPYNGIAKLYAQLLAAKLNIANGANADDIEDYLTMADDFLTGYSWMSWENLDEDQRKKVLEWKDVFDDYNNGVIGPGYCEDDDDDVDDNDGEADEMK